MIKKTFDVAVILINFNSSKYSINCIQSIIKYTTKDISYQIIVIDNCSDKDDFLELQEFCNHLDFPDLTLFRSKRNSGFGGGNMQGVQFANAKYLAFINNDTTLCNDCFSILMQEVEKNPTIGVATAQAYKEDGEFLISIDHFASLTREILGRDFLELIDKQRYPKRHKLYSELTKAEFVSGAFMFLRTTDFYEAGGFDTNIFLYYEETDLCKRLLKKHKYAYLVPMAKYIHVHGASTSTTKSLLIKKELKISLLYVIKKHYGTLPYFILLSFLTTKYLFTSIAKPQYWSFFVLMLSGASLSKSLKQQQKISNL